MKRRCKFPDDIFAGPKHVEIIQWSLCVPEYFCFIISIVSFYLTVRPHVAAGEQFIVFSRILLILRLFLSILVHILQFNRLLHEETKGMFVSLLCAQMLNYL